MAVRHPCYRHARSAWIAGCPDCTAWHRAALTERRAGAEKRGSADVAEPVETTGGPAAAAAAA